MPTKHRQIELGSHSHHCHTLGCYVLLAVNIFLWSDPSRGLFWILTALFFPVVHYPLSTEPQTEIHWTRVISSRACKKCHIITQFCYQDYRQSLLRTVKTIRTFASSSGSISLGSVQLQTVPWRISQHGRLTILRTGEQSW